MVSTLEDISNNKQAHALVDINHIGRLLNKSYLQEYKAILKHLIYNHHEYENILNKTIDVHSIHDVAILNKLINGHVIIVLNSYYVRLFEQLFLSYSNMFIISKQKYFKNYWFYGIPKNLTIYHELKFMYVLIFVYFSNINYINLNLIYFRYKQIVQNGLYYHHDIIFNTIRRVQYSEQDTFANISLSETILEKPIDLIDYFQIDLILLLYGFIFSIIILIIEIIAYHIVYLYFINYIVFYILQFVT